MSGPAVSGVVRWCAGGWALYGPEFRVEVDRDRRDVLGGQGKGWASDRSSRTCRRRGGGSWGSTTEATSRPRCWATRRDVEWALRRFSDLPRLVIKFASSSRRGWPGWSGCERAMTLGGKANLICSRRGSLARHSHPNALDSADSALRGMRVHLDVSDLGPTPRAHALAADDALAGSGKLDDDCTSAAGHTGL